MYLFSESERAFQPWWDKISDYTVYGLVILGVMLVPTSMVIATPLDCTYCQELNCEIPPLQQDIINQTLQQRSNAANISTRLGNRIDQTHQPDPKFR